MALLHSKFCQLSEYARFLKLRRSQNASGLPNQDLVDFALAHTKSNHNQGIFDFEVLSHDMEVCTAQANNLHKK